MKFVFKTEPWWESRDWFSFYKKWMWVNFQICTSFYFDPRWYIHFTLTCFVAFVSMIALLTLGHASALLLLPFCLFGYGHVFFALPIVTIGRDADAEYNQYGIGVYADALEYPSKVYVYYGRKSKWLSIPFWTLEYYGISYLMADNTWLAIRGYTRPEQDKHIELHRMSDVVQYRYVDESHDVITDVVLMAEEREWRRYGLSFLPFFAAKRRDLVMKFEKEIGSDIGSYKGGLIECSFSMKNDETLLDAFARWQREYSFKRKP